MFLELLLLSGGLYAGAEALFGTPRKKHKGTTSAFRSAPSSASVRRDEHPTAPPSRSSSAAAGPEISDPPASQPLAEPTVQAAESPAGALGMAASALDEEGGGRRVLVKELRADRDLQLAVVASGLLASGYLLLPPLWLLGSGLVLWQVGARAVSSARALARDRQVSSSVAELALATTVVAGGFLGAASVGFVLLAVSKKVAAHTESVAQHRLLRTYQTHSLYARMKVDGQELLLPVHKVKPGDQVVVDSGQRIPVDGKICQGGGTIDQRMLTGEDWLVEKGTGDTVLAATRLISGQLILEAERTDPDTAAAKVEQVLERAVAYKHRVTAASDALSRKLSLPTLAMSGAAYLLGGLSGSAAILALPAGQSLRYTGPVALLTYLNQAAESSVLIRDARALERLAQVDTVVFDRTSALTLARLRVVALHSFATYTDEEVLALAVTAEQGEAHPIAEAILQEAQILGIHPLTDAQPKHRVRSGFQFQHRDERVLLGGELLMRQEQVFLGAAIVALQQHADARGNTLVMVAVDDLLIGAIELQATLRDEAQDVVALLKMRNLSLALVSGDREPLTVQCAARLGIDHYVAGASVAEKALFIRSLQDQGRTVCFVGTGLRQAQVVKSASVSVSLCGAAASLADPAEVVLTDRSLRRLPTLFSMAEDFNLTMNTNVEASITPAVFSGIGVLLFNTGLLTALGIYYSVSAIALLNSIIPAFRRREPV